MKTSKYLALWGLILMASCSEMKPTGTVQDDAYFSTKDAEKDGRVAYDPDYSYVTAPQSYEVTTPADEEDIDGSDQSVSRSTPGQGDTYIYNNQSYYNTGFGPVFGMDPWAPYYYRPGFRVGITYFGGMGGYYSNWGWNYGPYYDPWCPFNDPWYGYNYNYGWMSPGYYGYYGYGWNYWNTPYYGYGYNPYYAHPYYVQNNYYYGSNPGGGSGNGSGSGNGGGGIVYGPRGGNNPSSTLPPRRGANTVQVYQGGSLNPQPGNTGGTRTQGATGIGGANGNNRYQAQPYANPSSTTAPQGNTNGGTVRGNNNNGATRTGAPGNSGRGTTTTTPPANSGGNTSDPRSGAGQNSNTQQPAGTNTHTAPPAGYQYQQQYQAPGTSNPGFQTPTSPSPSNRPQQPSGNSPNGGYRRTDTWTAPSAPRGGSSGGSRGNSGGGGGTRAPRR